MSSFLILILSNLFENIWQVKYASLLRRVTRHSRSHNRVLLLLTTCLWSNNQISSRLRRRQDEGRLLRPWPTTLRSPTMTTAVPDADDPSTERWSLLLANAPICGLRLPPTQSSRSFLLQILTFWPRSNVDKEKFGYTWHLLF